MQNKTKMLRKLIFAVIFTVVLTVLLSGCGKDEISIDGKYVATFELEGGTLQTPTSSVSNKINFAYHPDTYVLDPIKLNGYDIIRPDYEFTGWYTDKSCNEASKWDFENTVISTENLTLYAGWQKAIKLTYTLYYIDETTNQQVALDSYKVQSKAKFDDWKNIANTRIGYTPLGYFSDPECKSYWEDEFEHPGTDTDLDVPVYVSYIKGNWTFVDSVSALKNAIYAGKDIYLTGNIDCKGELISFGNYGGQLNGNGYTISNFRIEKSGKKIVSCSIFKKLEDGAIIKDVAFTGVIYDLTGITGTPDKVKVAALAVSGGNIKIENVSVSGVVETNYTGELTAINEFIYETIGDSPEVEIVDSVSSVTVQIVN